MTGSSAVGTSIVIQSRTMDATARTQQAVKLIRTALGVARMVAAMLATTTRADRLQTRHRVVRRHRRASGIAIAGELGNAHCASKRIKRVSEQMTA